MGRRSLMWMASLLFSISIQSVEAQMIKNIKQFLEQCPTNDPAYEDIRSDFKIRRNGALVGALSCSEPISQIPIKEYTDELIVVQGLRVMYYMDRGLTGHLSWTSGNLYDWMKSRIGGIDIRDGVVGGYCCTQYDGKTYIVIGSQDDFNRDFDRAWRGIAGNIAFYAHEARHVDGFPHSSCCGVSNGCDSDFSDSNPSAYAVQWILNKLWLTGKINVGYGCLSENEVNDIANWHLGSCNGSRSRFCVNVPTLLSLPSNPGGICPLATFVDFSHEIEPPLSVELQQNFPNPFNPNTTFRYQLPKMTKVSLRVYDVLGQLVATIVDEEKEAGNYQIDWSPRMPSGIYFYRLQVGEIAETKKLLLLK